MNSRCCLALGLLAIPSFAHAQTTATETPVPPAQTAPALPPPPPGAGPDGAPPPAAPITVMQQPPPPYGLYGQQPAPGYAPAYGQPPIGQPLYGQSPYGMFIRRRVVEYHGGPIPRGAALETRRPMALVIGGGVVFGGLYLISVLSAAGSGGLISCTVGCGGSWLYAPIFGPFVAMGIGMHPTEDQIVLAIDGIFQTAGVVAFIVGMLRTQQVLVFTEYARNESRRPQWTLAPGAPGAALGATLSVMQF